MTKLRKAPPPAYPGINTSFPSFLQAGTRYEDLPLLPNYPYFRGSQDHASNLVSSSTTPPTKQSRQTSNLTASGSNTPTYGKPTPQYVDRHRSSSAPAPKSRRASPRVAEDGHGSTKPPQYNGVTASNNPQSPQPQRAPRKSCPSNCTKCGKRRSESRSGAPDSDLNPRPTAPRAMAQAHTRAVSEGAIPRSNSPVPAMPAIPGSSFLGPTDLKHKQCHKCGKPKKPASMQNPTVSNGLGISEPSDWPLPALNAGPSQSQPVPMIMRGFENNQSTTTLALSPFIANEEDSPLIAKKPADFNNMCEASARATYTRVPVESSEPRPAGLIRRISNALRPAAEAPVSSPSAATSSRPSHIRSSSYLSVPTSEAPIASPRPFSFVGEPGDGEFEMIDLRTSIDRPISRGYPFDLSDSYSPSMYLALPKEDVNERKDQVMELEGDNAVMRRAVSGSIQRFKSLKGAHRNWYRNDLDINAAGYDYEGGRMVDVY